MKKILIIAVIVALGSAFAESSQAASFGISLGVGSGNYYGNNYFADAYYGYGNGGGSYYVGRTNNWYGYYGTDNYFSGGYSYRPGRMATGVKVVGYTSGYQAPNPSTSPIVVSGSGSASTGACRPGTQFQPVLNVCALAR